jgi:hypothetical protein
MNRSPLHAAKARTAAHAMKAWVARVASLARF